jgi:hypothetical protein
MHELDPDLRRLLETARNTEIPTQENRARVAAAIAAKTGVSVLSVAGAVALATKATAQGAAVVTAPATVSGLAVTGKVVAALVLAAGVGVFAIPQARRAVVSAVRGTPAAVVTPEAAAPPAADPSLAQEAALLEAAQRAFRDGHPQAALPLLDEHDQRFPSGALRPESLAARVMVLCRLDRQREAKQAAAAFFKEAPASPLAPQVRASCAGD